MKAFVDKYFCLIVLMALDPFIHIINAVIDYGTLRFAIGIPFLVIQAACLVLLFTYLYKYRNE